MSECIYWSVLWSAGFSVFKLKWKMNGVLIDGECMWLMECVLEMDSVRVWYIFFFLIIFTTLVVFIIGLILKPQSDWVLFNIILCFIMVN